MTRGSFSRVCHVCHGGTSKHRFCCSLGFRISLPLLARRRVKCPVAVKRINAATAARSSSMQRKRAGRVAQHHACTGNQHKYQSAITLHTEYQANFVASFPRAQSQKYSGLDHPACTGSQANTRCSAFASRTTASLSPEPTLDSAQDGMYNMHNLFATRAPEPVSCSVNPRLRDGTRLRRAGSGCTVTCAV
jgi:hypothetical protein